MLENEPIISVSGLRGIVDQTLTPEVVVNYIAAFAAELPPGPVIVTRDGRASGAMLADAVGTALAAAGLQTLDAGVAATPTTGVLVKSLHAVGGVQISASHNPAEYNGLKLFNRDGRVIPAAEGQRVLDRYRGGSAADAWKSHEHIAVSRTVDDPTSAHLDLVDAVCDVERIRDHGYRVLLDANHGAGSVLGQRLLEHLGCQTTILGDTPDGQFAHPPEPTEANLQTVLQQVERHGAHVGFCQDPDADRLAVIDDQAVYIGEEHTLALCAAHVLRRRPGPIVTNCSTSRMTEDLATKYGAPFFRSKVGEANVVDVMLAENAVLGGEGNGGVIDPRVVLVRDSFVAMALVLDAMASRDLPVSALAGELPQYSIHKTKIELPPERVAEALQSLKSRFSEAQSDAMDGLRLDWPDGAWLLVRPSNTEPIVRAIAEAPSADQARRLCDEAAAAIAG